jgi:hypothetical protein
MIIALLQKSIVQQKIGNAIGGFLTKAWIFARSVIKG